MIKHHNKLIALAVISTINQAQANSIIIEDLIFSNAKAPYDNYCNTTFIEGSSGFLRAAKKIVCSQNNTKESIKNVQLSGGPVRYSAIIPAAIPESAEKESYVVSNCTSIPRKEKNSYSVTFEEGSDLTTSTSIKSSQNASLNLKFSVVDFSVGGSREVNTSQEGKQSFKKSVTRSVEVDETVQPYSTLIIDIEQRLSNAYVDFDGDVRVESDYGVTKYSTVVPNNWVTIKGQLWNSSARSLTKSFRELKLDPNTCNAASLKQTTSARAAAIAAAPAAESKIDDLKAFSKTGSPLQPAPTVMPFNSGMILQTADVMSHVQVRLRANGSTACMANFTAADTKTGLLALPGEWSRWHNVAFVPNQTAIKILSDETCAAGITADVRYIK